MNEDSVFLVWCNTWSEQIKSKKFFLNGNFLISACKKWIFFVFPYFLYANSILWLASIANTCEFGFDENNLALFPTPVPASRIVEHVFKKLLNFSEK